jgi:hypothetical protein
MLIIAHWQLDNGAADLRRYSDRVRSYVGVIGAWMDIVGAQDVKSQPQIGQEDEHKKNSRGGSAKPSSGKSWPRFGHICRFQTRLKKHTHVTSENITIRLP